MLRKLVTRFRDGGIEEEGQALVLFALGAIAFLGLVAMSIDVGRLVWARTQMQSAVDAAVLAAAQDMPNGTAQAQTAGDTYWLKNSGFIQSQGENVSYTTTFPAGNRAVQIHAQAEIPTWFARVFGLDHWNVSADGTAASQVLDIAVVLDISGSMCFGSYPQTESASNIYVMSPGRLSPSGGYAFPKLTTAISAATGNSITINLNDIRVFNNPTAATNAANFGSAWNNATPYWNFAPAAGSSGAARKGMIMIDQELFQITAVNAGANTLTVTRAMTNTKSGAATVKAAHALNAEVWGLRGNSTSGNNYCWSAGKYTPTSGQNGPHEPFDSAITDAQYFTTLFNSAYDKIGAAQYSSGGTIMSNLTSNFSGLRSSMDNILWPTGGTNIAWGLAEGRQIATGAGQRANSLKVIVLLTDGMATDLCGGSTYSASSYNASCTNSTNANAPGHAYSEAIRAANAGITIYTIGLGSSVDDNFLERVADGGTSGVGPCQQNKAGCRYYKAPTTAQLDDAFQLIAAQTHITLTR